MTRFEYQLPGETTVKRRFEANKIQDDRFDILAGRRVVATVDYQLARRYWLGELTLDEVLSDDKEV